MLYNLVCRKYNDGLPNATQVGFQRLKRHTKKEEGWLDLFGRASCCWNVRLNPETRECL
jgi:hypothetical protein